jgi:glutamate-1-semialdehyde aminotransferase
MDFTYLRRASQSIAQGALTNSKMASSHIKGVYPTHLADGQGCRVLGVDGKAYTDYICGLGANLLGYGNAAIAKAIAENAGAAFSMSLGTPTEYRAAEKLKEFFCFIDSVKFLKTGTEACMAAIRIARAVTGRSKVLSHGYHGWSDAFVNLTPPGHGTVPSQSELFKSVSQIDSETACVIIEPVITDCSSARIHEVREIQKACEKHGALLIFDEVITGFRYENHGVCNAWGIIPDLICLGKSMGGGLPLAAVGGKDKIMQDMRYFVSSTFAGERLSLEASMAFMAEMQKHRHQERMQENASQFKQRFNELCPRVQIEGYPLRGTFVGDPLDKALFFQEACKSGILFGPSFFWCLPHKEYTDITLAACSAIFRRLELGELKLEGEMPQSPFAMKARAQ